MFEDEITGSWWRQATGDAAVGPEMGKSLTDIPFLQTTLQQWQSMFPQTWVMQGDLSFQEEYDSMQSYEKGRIKGKLTRRDTGSWKDKSWVVGVDLMNQSKAYDWNELKKRKIIHDNLGGVPIVVALASDGQSFVAFKRRNLQERWTIKNDRLMLSEQNSTQRPGSALVTYDLHGKPDDTINKSLELISAYQEYWHSWQTFHPKTKK
jgi:hypothetical protein